MTATIMNNKPRRSLAEQIDRLDDILDGLADGLNGAVATVVQETVAVAVKEAVQAVMAELLSRPEILAKLQATFAPAKPKDPEPAKPTLKDRIGNFWKKVVGGCKRVGTVCKAAVVKAATWTASLVRKVVGTAGTVIASCAFVGRFKKQILLAIGIGTVVALGTWWAGPWLSTVAGWVGGFATTLAVQCVLGFRRVMDSFGQLAGPTPAWAGNGACRSN